MLPDSGLPQPSPEIQGHSDAFVQMLKARISDKGPLTFAEYMHLALYQPGFGYYVAGLEKFGERGDFTTAPESGRLFAGCLANQIAEVFRKSAGVGFEGSVLEFGAGSGRLCREILESLVELNCVPANYFILEPGTELRERQNQMIEDLPEDLKRRVVWLESLPEKFSGVVLANEVLDAMPVERFLIGPESSSGAVNNTVLQILVDSDEEGLVLTSRIADSHLTRAVQDLQQSLHQPLPEGYCSEVNLNFAGWMASLSDLLETGAILLIDYGYPRSEYYLPERFDGSLMCYFRQHAHSDALFLPCGQDITSHVDFTAVAESATEAGLELNGFASQSAFLRANGLLELADSLQGDTTLDRLRIASEVKTLAMPDSMGERFSVMGLSKDIDFALQGFTMEDYSHRL